MISYLFLILFLCFLEGILSLDNAVVLAVLVKPLPIAQQRKALTYGIASAFLFRAISLFFITQILHNQWIKMAGGLYLVWIAGSFFWNKKNSEDKKPVESRSFLKTIIMVEAMDIVFSIDSILASVSISQIYWVILTGGILGIIMMRFSASFFVKLIERFPTLEDIAYELVCIIGAKLVFQNLGVNFESLDSPYFWGYWLTIGTAIGFGIAKVWTMAKREGWKVAG